MWIWFFVISKVSRQPEGTDVTQSTGMALSQKEFQSVNDVMMQHFKKIHGLLKEKSILQTDKIISENKTALFNTDQMLTDWSQRGTSSQCSSAIQLTSQMGEPTDSAWPSDEELQWISRHLTKESMTKICRELHIDCISRDFDKEKKRLESLREWRKKEAKKSIEKKHMKLFLALETSNLRGLLPPLKGRFVYKVEVVDMALQLLIHDLLPLAEALDINVTKLISYRPAFQPFHLTVGTTDLLTKLLQSITPDKLEILEKEGRRSFFCSKIGKLQYRRVATNGMLMYDMSYGELSSVLAAMIKNTGERSKGQGKGESPSGEKKSPSGEPSTPNVDKEGGTDIGNGAESGLLAEPNSQKSEVEKKVKDTEIREHQTDPQVGVSKYIHDLKNVLKLTDQDISDGLQSSHQITALALFRIWKEMPRSSVFNYRAALAYELREIKMPGLASEVIAGKYINEQTSFEFIKNMVLGLTQDQLRSLRKLLNLSGKDEQSHKSESVDLISRQIYDWVADWTKEMKNSWYMIKVLSEVRDDIAEVTSLRTTPKKHKDLNDKLVEHGFLDLAREIMIIEQQLSYAEPNALRRIANMKPKDVISLVHVSEFSKLFSR